MRDLARYTSFAAFAILFSVACTPNSGEPNKGAAGDASLAAASPNPPSASVAKAGPGKGLAVSVDVKNVVIRSDTTGVTYVVSLGPDSRDSLATFVVDAPSGVLTIRRPEPARDWFVRRPTPSANNLAYWARLGGLPPGDDTAPLYFEGLGVPGIVTYWSAGRVPIPEGEGEGDDSTTREPWREDAVSGKTDGVEPFPEDRTARGWLIRLRSLTMASCGSSLAWIADQSLCGRLLGQVDSAEAYRAAGAKGQAEDALDGFRKLLTGGGVGPAAGVTTAAYWLLTSTAAITKDLI